MIRGLCSPRTSLGINIWESTPNPHAILPHRSHSSSWLHAWGVSRNVMCGDGCSFCCITIIVHLDGVLILYNIWGKDCESVAHSSRSSARQRMRIIVPAHEKHARPPPPLHKKHYPPTPAVDDGVFSLCSLLVYLSLSLLVLVLCGRSKTQTPTPSLLVPYIISRTPARVHSSCPLARPYFIAPAHDNNKDNPPHTHAHTSNASRAAGHSGHPNVTVLGDISVTLLPPTPCA